MSWCSSPVAMRISVRAKSRMTSMLPVRATSSAAWANM